MREEWGHETLLSREVYFDCTVELNRGGSLRRSSLPVAFFGNAGVIQIVADT